MDENKGNLQKRKLWLMVAGIVTVTSASVFAAEPVVYPSKGQSNDKMEKDKFSCYQWAKQQTGVDPMQGATASTGSQQPGAGRTAARGAAVGAIGGAIGGSAGKGAAIGAATGGIVGGARKRKSEKEQQASAEGSRAAYDRAWSACMEGKDYTVK
jgi:hypothetical protein